MRKIIDQNKNLIKQYYPLLLILAVGVTLRLWNLSSEGLRLDEAQSVWQASHTLEFIKDYMIKNVHLPLHNFTLHFWMRLFGNDETTVRVLSLIPGVLAIPAIYLLASEMLDEQRARFTMFLGALSPFWIWYSREIRMYSLLMLVTTLSYYFFVKVLKTNRLKYYVLYVLINAIGIYTHYYFFLALSVQGLFFLITYKHHFSYSMDLRKSEVLIKLFISLFIDFLIFLPWIYLFVSASRGGSFAPELLKPDAFNIFISYFQFIFGFQYDYITSVSLGLWPLMMLAGFIFLTKRHNPFNYWVFLSIMGALLPVLVVFTVSVLYRPVYLTRYLTPVTPMLYVFLTWYIFELKGYVRSLFIVLISVAMFLGYFNQTMDKKNPAREDYRSAIEYINKRVTHRDAVLVAPPYNLYPFQYYYTGSAVVYTMPIWDKRDGAIPTATIDIIQEDVEYVRDGHSKMYLLVSENLANTEEVKEYLNQNFTKLEKVEFSKDLWLHVYQAEYY